MIISVMVVVVVEWQCNVMFWPRIKRSSQATTVHCTVHYCTALYSPHCNTELFSCTARTDSSNDLVECRKSTRLDGLGLEQRRGANTAQSSPVCRCGGWETGRVWPTSWPDLHATEYLRQRYSGAQPCNQLHHPQPPTPQAGPAARK